MIELHEYNNRKVYNVSTGNYTPLYQIVQYVMQGIPFKSLRRGKESTRSLLERLVVNIVTKKACTLSDEQLIKIIKEVNGEEDRDVSNDAE